MAEDPPKATRIGGFEVLECLGQGGMGTVYKARQVSMDRIVALKVLPPKLAKNEAFVQRFVREARSAARLNHPNIVQGIDVGHAGGHYYFAMEFVDGVTVKDLIQREGRIEEKKALNIIGAVARALEHAQEHGIIHRDIKPDNIMITRKGVVKLADLGLARSTEKPDTLTVEGTALGTPYYMSPEQVRGETDIDTRADIYALGATLYHMFTGEFAFDGPNAGAIMAKHIAEPLPSPKEKTPALSRAACELIERMMAKDPADRPQTPTELLAEIRDALAGKVRLRPRGRPRVAQPPSAVRTPVGGVSPPRVHPRAKNAPYVIAGGVIVVLVAVIIGLLLGLRPGTKPPEEMVTKPPTKEEPDVTTKQETKPEVEDKKADLEAKARAEKRLEREIAQLRSKCNALVGKDQFAEALKRLEDFAEKHRSGKGANEAKKLRSEVLGKAKKRYEAFADAADAAAKRKAFAKARAALKPVESFGIPELAERAKRKLAEVNSREKSAEQWAQWDEVKASVAKLVEAGKFDEAVQQLQKGKTIQLDGMADLIAEETQKVEDARRKAAEAAIAAYMKESDKVWALLKQRKYPEADDLLKQLAADPRFIVGGVSTPREGDAAWGHAAHNMLQADQEAANLLKEFWAAVERGVLARKGKFVSIAGRGGNVEKVEGGQVTLKVGAKVYVQPLLGMDWRQAAALGDLKDDDPRANLAKAVFLLAEGEKLDDASKLLAAAGNPPGVAFYKDRLAAVTLGAAELAARKAWAEIEALAKAKLTKAQVARLGEMLDRFEKEHGQSKTGKQVADQVTALRARVGRAAEPIVYTEWPFDAAEASRRQEQTAKALRVKVEQDIDCGNGVKLSLVLIPAGEFRMGSPRTTSPEKLAATYGGNPKDYEREFPQHRVKISRPFWMGKYLVTQEQWMALFGTNPSRFKDKPKNPVERVNWSEAKGFAKVLSEKLGKPFRLPTEAEWEYACRAGTATEFYFGNDAAEAGDFGWLGIDWTAPVGMKKPNAWGLYDMGGNVWQWCEDWYGVYANGSESDPTGAPAGSARVLRGGYYTYLPGTRRSACRNAIDPGARLGHVGFRVVLAPEAWQAAEAVKPGEWQSLFDAKSLRWWKPYPGGEGSKVSVRSGRVVLKGGQPVSAIIWTRDFPRVDYEVAVDVMRAAGPDAFCIVVFPIAESRCALALGGMGGRTVGLGLVDGRGFNKNMTTRQMAFENERWYRLRLRVARGKVEAWIDDEKIADLGTAGHAFSVYRAWAPLDPFGVSTTGATTGALRNMRVRRLPGAVEPRGEAPKAGKWQSLFDGKSLRGWRVVSEGRYARHGKVHIKNGQLVLQAGPDFTGIAWAREFPDIDYEISMEAMRVAGGDAFCIVCFPIGGSRCAFTVGGVGGGVTGLQLVDGLGYEKNVTTRRMNLQNGRWYGVRLRVTRSKIEAWIDREKVVDLATQDHSLTTPDFYRLLPMGLVTWKTTGALRNIRLRRLGK